MQILGFKPRHANGSCLYRTIAVIAVLFIIGGLAQTAAGENSRRHEVAIVISDEISPFIQAAEGLKQRLGEIPEVAFETVYLNKYEGRSRRVMISRIVSADYFPVVAIGPDAARLLWQADHSKKGRFIYSIVLNPQRISGIDASACGISLNIPVRRQLAVIRQGLPGIERIGLFFDPDNNSNFYHDAAVHARKLQLSVIPFSVNARQDIPDLLKNRLAEVDALWLIPDHTVISESIVQYIIKQGLLKSKPLIGYNKFFFDSGAALAFVFDYGQLGRQTGDLIADRLAGAPCGSEPPVFEAWLNQRIYEMLDIEVKQIQSESIRVKP